MQRLRNLLSDPARPPIKWLFYGDSITHGATHTFGCRDYVELFTERLRSELPFALDVVIKTAISGHTTRELLEQYDWRVGQFKPDVVLVMIGMNDCSAGKALPLSRFEANLAELARRLSDDGALAVLQTTCPVLPGAAVAADREPYLDAYMDAVRRCARQHKLPLIDHADYWRKHPDSLYFWMSNAFHPNHFGHRAFAFKLFEDMGVFDPAARSCRLMLP